MTSSERTSFEKYSLDKWLEEQKDYFLPPVCNRMMFNEGQLKVMWVTGPNIRKDYHLEEGEELFFQLRGAMSLPTWEKGQRKVVEIAEGHIFVLPRLVPHSPNRYAGTMGLVIERQRAAHETDALRYYVEGGGKDDVLYREWFHCTDLGTQLPPVIQRYFASEEHRTGRPDPAKRHLREPISEDESVQLVPPFSLAEALAERAEALLAGCSFLLFERPEFRVRVRSVSLDEEVLPFSLEKLVWVYRGHATLNDLVSGQSLLLDQNDFCLIHADVRHQLVIDSTSSIILEIWMIPTYSSSTTSTSTPSSE